MIRLICVNNPCPLLISGKWGVDLIMFTHILGLCIKKNNCPLNAQDYLLILWLCMKKNNCPLKAGLLNLSYSSPVEHTCLHLSFFLAILTHVKWFCLKKKNCPLNSGLSTSSLHLYNRTWDEWYNRYSYVCLISCLTSRNCKWRSVENKTLRQKRWFQPPKCELSISIY